MKNFKTLIAIVLCVVAVFALASCSGGKKNSISMTVVDMSLEDAKAKIVEAGCTPVVISVYDEKNEDGAVLSIGEFTGKDDSGFVTVAVNDLSIKSTVEAQSLAPRIIPRDVYEKDIYEKISSDESLKKTFDSLYTLKSCADASEKERETMQRTYPITKTTDVYVLDTGVSAKELSNIEEYLKEKTEYTAEDMFRDYIEVGIVPTPNNLLKAEVLSADNCDLEETDEGVTVTLYKGEGQNIVVPTEINGKPVVALAEGSLPHSTLHSLTTVDGLKSISAEACSNAYGLMNVTLSNTITDLGLDAFENALFTKTDGAFTTFADCVLLSYKGSDAEVTIPEGIRFIGAEAFIENKSITKVTLPEGVQAIGNAAFKLCENITEFNIPSTTLKVGDEAFLRIRHITKLIIPDSVIEIGNSAFLDCNDVTEFSLGEGIKKIGDNAFEYVMLITTLDIPESVEYLGNYAFYHCQAVETVTGGEGLKFVGTGAFEDVAWYNALNEENNYINDTILIKTMVNESDINVPENVTCISGVYQGKKKIKTVVINDGCTAIAKDTFTECVNLLEVTIPASVTYIDAEAFDKSNINITFHVEAGSAAEQFAKDNHYKYDNNI